MFSLDHRFLPDVSVYYTGVYWGIGLAIFSFLMVVIIEARVMKKYFPFSKWRRYGYSFIINLISTMIGLPLVYWLDIHLSESEMMTKSIYGDLLTIFTDYSEFPPMTINFLRGLLLAFVMTLIIEYFSILFIVRQRSAYMNALRFTVKANAISYLALAIVPPILTISISLLIGHLSRLIL